MQNEKRFWEVPEVDLNFRHYSGHPSDAIKLIKRNIERYLIKPGVPQKDVETYSAVFNALNYYRNILYSSASDFSTGPTFLNHSLSNMKKDYEYLSKKYNSNNPTIPPVITMNGRIKSPISALEKIKDKIEEYLENGIDLRYLNESLRDFMGVRIIVDPPQEVKDKGIDAEEDFLREVLVDLLEFHGIKGNEVADNYTFIPVNTKNNPNKVEKIALDGNEDKLPDYLMPYVKNYVDHPKESGYQSYHVCATPEYSNEVQGPTLPPYIIPPVISDYSFEYQIRTKRMDEVAEHGIASHDDYKDLGAYHRLSIPFYIEFKEDDKKYKVLNIEESCRKHFGYVPFLRVYSISGMYLKDMSLVDFRDIFTSSERDATIDGKNRIYYFEERGFDIGEVPTSLVPTRENVKLESTPSTIFLSQSELGQLKSSPENYQAILEESYATDGMIVEDGEDSVRIEKPQIEIYTVETSEERRQKQNSKTAENSKESNSKESGSNSNKPTNSSNDSKSSKNVSDDNDEPTY